MSVAVVQFVNSHLSLPVDPKMGSDHGHSKTVGILIACAFCCHLGITLNSVACVWVALQLVESKQNETGVACSLFRSFFSMAARICSLNVMNVNFPQRQWTPQYFVYWLLCSDLDGVSGQASALSLL